MGELDQEKIDLLEDLHRAKRNLMDYNLTLENYQKETEELEFSQKKLSQ